MIVVPFGKYQGWPLADVPTSYLRWAYDLDEPGEIITTFLPKILCELESRRPPVRWASRPGARRVRSAIQVGHHGRRRHRR